MEPVTAGKMSQMAQHAARRSTDEGTPATVQTGSDGFKAILNRKADIVANRAQTASKTPADAGRLPSDIGERLEHALESIQAGQAEFDRLIHVISSGKPLSQRELLGIQAEMLRVSREIQAVSKVVEQIVGGLKTTLQTQV